MVLEELRPWDVSCWSRSSTRPPLGASMILSTFGFGAGISEAWTLMRFSYFVDVILLFLVPVWLMLLAHFGGDLRSGCEDSELEGKAKKKSCVAIEELELKCVDR